MYKKKNKTSVNDWRISAIRVFFIFATVIIIFRLFSLQVLNFSFYEALASGQHSFYKELFAKRGSIILKDRGDDTEYFGATNEPRGFLYADPTKIENPISTAKMISEVLGYEVLREEVVKEGEGLSNLEEEVILTDEEVNQNYEEVIEESIEEPKEPEEDPYKEYRKLVERFSKENDPYEPIARGVGENVLKKIDELKLPGIHYILEDARSYPEAGLGGHIFGFVRDDDKTGLTGQYGLEGYFNEFLAGKNGFLDTETDVSGRWIGVGSRDFEPATNGGNILLTIDRTVQYIACKELKAGVERYDADSGSVIIMDPKTGKILAMCSVPDFDPNEYNMVEDISIYNNNAIFTAYEPGSVIKPITMAGAIDIGALTPTTTYTDEGEVDVDDYTIRNSDLKSYGLQTMTEVLEKSLNTGMVFVMRQMGPNILRDYLKQFGFGRTTGIELDTESSGTIESLEKSSEIYFATASYGQGFTVTPLQLTVAYGALANNGMLMKPYIVEERRYSNDTVEKTIPKSIRQVISKKTSTTIGAMLVSVVENGHGTGAQVPGYYIAGKTGTAQVAKKSGLGYELNHTKATFAGFGPVKDPVFVMVVMLDRPKAVEWAADTSAPIFGNIAEFLMQYYEVAPSRPIE